MANMKIKAAAKGSVVKSKVMIKHDMLTYDQAKAKGKEANFITHITAKAGGKVVLDMSSSQFLSKNPLIQFAFSAEGLKAGDKLEMTWTDLSGQTVTEDKEIKGLK
ncbi:thiosulfate oxidation carrier complex protein SoxZ [Sulfurovum sp. zt1-1]|uniref:Thiosulfate oxidation carrier complex protein SoxZ n=1 Tax=Sulfurovum zhangzhouensis TaxID=3019067 RepID=A0ABT7R065_9BACT|nr:thiosulfate oxidation carrier complex protein SoxZ [Sulfurovum zhangzhouensis]MDM5272446.1 thiosulfate oxidation carrier complex protein SoxZ [Sulfurovum zhangzhouensis]